MTMSTFIVIPLRVVSSQGIRKRYIQAQLGVRERTHLVVHRFKHIDQFAHTLH
jgi:hypothetical protein